VERPGGATSDGWLADLLFDVDGETEANARLMAAAPDLLKACGEVLKYLPLYGPRSEIKMMLTAAIEKALGLPPEGTPGA
jgi:hypothetical protein